ncbi:hypothetical protein [Streptomyces sp. NPDC002994]|uniref:hypothetical protein n=1 Tax=Streptomyces sp. NPDC002994 TaxID=3154441 RepID=UPI0033A3374A
MSAFRELTLTCPDGQSYTVDHATEIVPGLLVYRIPEGMHPSSPHRWRIGHHSGLSVADAMLREDAVAGAELLGTLADWTQDAAALKASIDPTDLFAKLSYKYCIAPASESLAPGADASSNGRYTDDDIRDAAAEFKAAGFNALDVLLAMAHRIPWSGLDTDEFNEAHSRIAELADAA